MLTLMKMMIKRGRNEPNAKTTTVTITTTVMTTVMTTIITRTQTKTTQERIKKKKEEMNRDFFARDYEAQFGVFTKKLARRRRFARV